MGVHITLLKNQLKKDGTTPVYITIHISSKTIKINTGVSVAPDNFDVEKNRIKGSSKKVKDDNLIIGKCLATINEIFVRYRLQRKKLTADLLLKEYNNPTLYIDFYAFMDKKLQERVKDNEISQISERHQRVALNKLKKYKPQLMFSEIDKDFINSFRRWLKNKNGNSVNTIQKTLAYFKIYLNIAVQEKIIDQNPFVFIANRRVNTERVFLIEKELIKLTNLYDKKRLTETLHRTLRHFLFMCFTGVRISDFVRLKKENLEYNVLKFIPYKTRTKKPISIHVPLIAKARQLIADENSQLPELFDTISEQKYNDQIKEIMNKVGIKKAVTNHSARHTFATMFLEKTNDVATLQKILGHTDIKDTMIYVHISTKKITEQMEFFDQKMENMLTAS